MRMRQFAKAARLGRVYGSDTGFVFEENPDTVRAPDVAFARRRGEVDDPPVGFLRGAPDLAVEVVSPHDRPREIA